MKRMILAALLLGCVNDDIRLYETQVMGSISATGKGTLHLEFHHAKTFGSGALSHPLGLFDSRKVTLENLPYRFDETLLYPEQKGEGLVVYGWLDTDGDGVLCMPGKPAEPAGLVRVGDFPSHQVHTTLVLDENCAGPETLYP